MNDVCDRYGITPAREADGSLVHHNIAEFTDNLSVPLKISRRAANIARIKPYTVRAFALFNGNKADFNPLLRSVCIPVQFIILQFCNGNHRHTVGNRIIFRRRKRNLPINILP